MSFTVSLFGTFIENLCTFLLLKSFQGKSKTPDRVDFIFFLPNFALVPLPDSYSLFSLIYGTAVIALYAYFRSGRKLIPAVFLASVTDIFLLFIQGLMILLLTPVMQMLPIDYLPILGSISTLIFVILVTLFAPCAKLYQRILSGRFALKFLILNTWLGVILKTLFYKMHMTDIYEFVNLMFAILFLMLSVNICIFYYEYQLKAKQEILRNYEKNKPLMETMITDIRSNQHEYANRLQSIAALANTCRDYDSLRSSLLKYTSAYSAKQKYYSLLTINMPLAASTLYNLSAMAEKKGLTVLFDIPTSELDCKVPEHILADFIHILTQNAIEASHEGADLYIVLKNMDGKFYFEVQNEVDEMIPQEEVKRFFKRGYSTKTDDSHPKPEFATPHGFGLYELLHQVNKLGGQVSADCIRSGDKNLVVFSLTL